MGDCVLSFICACPYADKDIRCGSCKTYLSANTEKGRKILDRYQEEINPVIDAALKPIREKYRQELVPDELMPKQEDINTAPCGEKNSCEGCGTMNYCRFWD